MLFIFFCGVEMFFTKKKMFYLIVFCVLIFALISSVDAFSIQKLDKNTVFYIDGKSEISVSIVTTDFVTEYKMKKDLNRINKIVVKVNRKTVNVIKKGKGWQKNEYYPLGIIDRETKVKGSIKGKKVSILAYNKKNELIKKQTNVVKSIRTTDFTKAQIKKICINYLKKWPEDFGNSSVTKVGKIKYLPLGNVWDVDFVNIKTGKVVGGTYINGETGDIAIV